MLSFRLAQKEDIAQISEIYDAIHTLEESGKLTTGWQRGVYPTSDTARTAIESGDMFVAELDGTIVASARINRIQVQEYEEARWNFEAPDEEVMVLHTLTVDPECSEKGYGTAFVFFYEQYALNHGCRYLRMDTNERNLNARSLYKKLGYKEVSIVQCVFNGIPGVNLVCLEKTLPQKS